MPIYEYFCKDCNVVFNFMSTKVAPDTIPPCPKCGREQLTKYLSSFTIPSQAAEGAGAVDEKKVEIAFKELLHGAQGDSDHDATDISGLMRSFTENCGMVYSDAMEDTLDKVSAGKEVMDSEGTEPLLLEKVSGKNVSAKESKGSAVVGSKTAPYIDEKIYQL